MWSRTGAAPCTLFYSNELLKRSYRPGKQPLWAVARVSCRPFSYSPRIINQQKKKNSIIKTAGDAACMHVLYILHGCGPGEPMQCKFWRIHCKLLLLRLWGSKADDACNGSDGLFGWSIVCTALHPLSMHLGLAGVVHVRSVRVPCMMQ